MTENEQRMIWDLHIRRTLVGEHHLFVIRLKDLSTYQPDYQFWCTSQAYTPCIDVSKAIDSQKKKKTAPQAKRKKPKGYERCTRRQGSPVCTTHDPWHQHLGQNVICKLTHARMTLHALSPPSGASPAYLAYFPVSFITPSSGS